MTLVGQNIIVLDLETLRSADDCRTCGKALTDHGAFATVCQDYVRLGWDDPAALGLSIGCFYDYRSASLAWFDVFTLEATVMALVALQPLLVSFNGLQFDFPLMHGLLRQEVAHRGSSDTALSTLCEDFHTLCARSYDLLAQIWDVDPDRKFEKGLNSLDVISQANGYGRKELDGAIAPVLWRDGQYARVLNYCAGDVRKTKALFEQVLQTGSLLRGDGRPLALPVPVLPAHVSFAVT